MPQTIIPVNKTDVEKLDKGLKKGIWMSLYHAEWCGHCKVFMNTWPAVMAKCLKMQVNVAQIENSVLPLLQEVKPGNKDLHAIESFPTLVLFIDGKPFKKYEGERTADKISHFVRTESSSPGICSFVQ